MLIKYIFVNYTIYDHTGLHLYKFNIEVVFHSAFVQDITFKICIMGVPYVGGKYTNIHIIKS